MIVANDFKAQWNAIRQRAQDALERVGSSGWLILGQEVEAFETQLAEYCSVGYAVGCASGLDALEIGLRCLDLQPGDKVLTTPLSAFATTLAILRAGCVPVFVDVDQCGLIDLDQAEAALVADSGIRAMVPVHLFGHAIDLDRLQEIKTDHRIGIVEDCAQAIGARFNGQPVGSVGECSALSFYPTKNLGAMGDGGCLLTNSESINERARMLRDYGQSAKYEHTVLGMNSRLDELQAAIMRDALLPQLEQFTLRRREIARLYRDGIVNPGISIPEPGSAYGSVWHLFPVVLDSDRDGFLEYLRSRNIAGAVHYPKLIPDQEACAKSVEHHILGALPVARRLADHEVSLPIHPFLSNEEIGRVIDACNDWRS
jgi:dTDP-3-amino-3,4,6-trideoxy-alpha-D-glucose transaminase